MKNLKNRAKALILTAVMVICTFANVIPAGAATLSADQYLKKMAKASNKVKSYEATVETVQDMETNGERTYTKTVQKMTSFSKPMKAKAVTTTTMKVGDKTNKQKMTMYMKANSKGKILTYMSTDGKKYDKDEIDVTEITDSLKSIDTNLYSNAKIVKKNVKVNKINTVQISAEISGENLGKTMSDTFASLGFDEFSVDASALQPVKVTVWVNQKTYLPVKVSMDMSEFMDGYMTLLFQTLGDDTTGSIQIDYKKAISTTTFSKYNKATNFTIPKACK